MMALLNYLANTMGGGGAQDAPDAGGGVNQADPTMNQQQVGAGSGWGQDFSDALRRSGAVGGGAAGLVAALSPSASDAMQQFKQQTQTPNAPLGSSSSPQLGWGSNPNGPQKGLSGL